MKRILRVFRGYSASLAAAAEQLLTIPNATGVFTIPEGMVGYVRHVGVARGGNSSAAIRVRIIDEGNGDFSFYPGDDSMMLPGVPDQDRITDYTWFQLKGRVTMSFINDNSALAATNIGVSIIIELVPIQVRNPE